MAGLPISSLLTALMAHRSRQGEILGASLEGGVPEKARAMGWLPSNLCARWSQSKTDLLIPFRAFFPV
jgi:hypothetical protein